MTSRQRWIACSIIPAFVACLALLTLSVMPRHARAAPTGAPAGGAGRLKVWVPAGAIGDTYWVYLDGRIVSAPPHPSRPAASDVITVKTKTGWEFWNKRGLVLRSVGDQGWDRNYDPYGLDSTALDALHLFQAIDLPLRAGKYNVDMAALSNPSQASLPFVFTGRWDVEVLAGRTKQLFLQVPAHFTNIATSGRAQGAFQICTDEPSPPSRAQVDSLQRTINEYMADPLVKSLHTASRRYRPSSARAAVIGLAASQGGPHEFDGAQIEHIVDAISSRFSIPSRSDIAACRNRFPQFASAYAEYGRFAADIVDDLQSLRDFAGQVKAGH